MINEPFDQHSLQTVLKYLLNYLSTFGYPASSIYDRELFMQNKPNFVRLRRIQNEHNLLFHNELCSSAEALAKAETNPKQSQNKPNQTQFIVSFEGVESTCSELVESISYLYYGWFADKI